MQPLLEIFLIFARLSLISFGGPAAHIALMQQELVYKRKWLSDTQFTDMLSLTNLIPGPNSTEMALAIGYHRAGLPGLILAGIGFILPASMIVLILAIIYRRWGSLPQAGWLLYGVKPVILAVILQALISLGKKAIHNISAIVLGAVLLALYFLKINELLLLLAGGLLYTGLIHVRKPGITSGLFLLPLGTFPILAASSQPVNLWTLFLVFLKTGSFLFGSGYVLLAFLRVDLVQRLGWLSDQQLLDAIAIGQITPGPLSTTATFIGYQLFGLGGAGVATLGIFLPAFLMIGVLFPLLPRLRAYPLTASFLDGLNIASLALMLGVTIQISRASIIDPLTAVLAGFAVLLTFRYKISALWLVAGGAVIGFLVHLWG